MLGRLFLILLAAFILTAGEYKPVIMLSFDALRHDYFERFPGEMPNFERVFAEGIKAGHMTPVFPTKTFPNHYTVR